MDNYLSAFDKLVQTISTEEAQSMLSKIQTKVNEVDSTMGNFAGSKYERDFVKRQYTAKSLKDESFLVRLFLGFLSFIKSIPIDKLYNDYLIKSLGRDLKKQASEYINVDQNTYTYKFYKSLKELRKSQLFFSGLLTTYDSEKGQFYMLVLSFVAPKLYETLMKKTDPCISQNEKLASASVKSNYLRGIDSAISQLTNENKAEIYECAKGIEWMKSLCDIFLDKVFFKFDVTSPTTVYCSPPAIQTEMQMLASVLASGKRIPNIALEGLFLLHQQDAITAQPEDLQEKLDKFLKEATEALRCIHEFISVIPLTQIIRYVGNDIKWNPIKIEGGEEWFVFFKHAWKERFNAKWSIWSSTQQKKELSEKMLSFFKEEKLLSLKHTPWVNLSTSIVFKRELSFAFIKTLFSKIYQPKISDLLKTLLAEGKFYRKENLNELTDSFASLKIHKDLLDEYERMLSPEGEIGDGFVKLKTEKPVGLKFKNTLDMLMRSVEVNAKQIVTGVESSLKSVHSILTGVLTGGKTGIYATIANRNTIKGSKNREFIERLEYGQGKIKTILEMFETLKKIENNG